uniref:Pyrroline-5-carboxylate reductase n=1 Tax=Plectus sambesii TaxID=2011161 RepID=A0A914W5W3_9BILA
MAKTAACEEFEAACVGAGLKPEIAFIGGGNMATALIEGFLKSGLVTQDSIFISVLTNESAAHWRKFGITTYTDNDELLDHHGQGLVFLAVKPHMLSTVALSIKRRLSRLKVTVSVLAGVRLSSLALCLAANDGTLCPLIRIMPNMPSAVGHGAAVLTASADCPQPMVELVTKLMQTVGTCDAIPESQMDAACALSGSGPAFVYSVIEAMSDGGVHAGLPRALATKLAAQTVMGAAHMVLTTEKHPGELKDMVCSPGGTTIAGIRALERGNLRSSLIEAVQAAAERSIQLGNLSQPATK